jgi:hypothetical protein
VPAITDAIFARDRHIENRIMKRFAIVATILTVVAGCDKLKSAAASAGGEPSVPVGELLDLSRKPEILFQVFGEKSDTRMIPLAALVDGAVKQINLTADGWREFAKLYETAGTSYQLYDDGQDVGSVTVRQGMWDNPTTPLYSLPNCTVLLPLAAVKLATRADVGFTVDLLASSATIVPTKAGTGLSEVEVTRIGREMGAIVGERDDISRKVLDALDFHGRAIQTGATSGPTIVASFVDPGNDDNSDQTLGHVFVIADRKEDGSYRPTFSHAFSGTTANAEYRAYLNHLDLTGDGVQEILLEARLGGSGTYVTALSYQNGGWQEIYRSRSGWCLDQ